MGSRTSKIIVLFLSLLLLNGCLTLGSKPIYLTDRDKTWIIPEGTSFQAIGDDGKLAERKALDDVVVLYKGALLRLEREADARVLKAEATGNKKAVGTGLGTLIAALSGLWAWIKKKKKKKKK